MKSCFKKTANENIPWHTVIDTIQYVINNTYHLSIKTTPSKLMFGIDKRKHADSELVDSLNKIAQIKLDTIEDRESARKLAIESTNKLKHYNKNYYDNKHKKPSVYKIGDYVLNRDSNLKTGESKKLKSEYKGPYTVAKILDKNRYVIKDIPGFQHTSKPYNSILSTDRMKPWVKPTLNFDTYILSQFRLYF